MHRTTLPMIYQKTRELRDASYDFIKKHMNRATLSIILLFQVQSFFRTILMNLMVSNISRSWDYISEVWGSLKRSSWRICEVWEIVTFP